MPGVHRYALSAIVLHWTIALLIAVQLGLGWRMVTAPQGTAIYPAYQLHKSIGIAILLLSLARLVLRLVKPRPAEIESGVAARWLARAVHVLLYGVMIGGPLTGWAVVSTSRLAVPTRLFGLLSWPHLPLGMEWNALSETLHASIAWLALALIVLHIAGALRHHVGVVRQNVLGRMVPGMAGDAAAGLGKVAAVALFGVGVLLLAFAVPWIAIRADTAPAVAVAEQARAPAQRQAPEVANAPESANADMVPDRAALENASETISAVATPSLWQVQTGGQLNFTASMNGAAVSGRFGRWAAKILFDPEALRDSRIEVRIVLASVDTDDGSRDETLKGADFFGGTPAEAIYTASLIRRIGSNRYRADGTLSMNGISRRIPLDFTLKIKGDKAVATGQTTLDRTSFQIGKGQWAATDQIAAKVDVAFSFRATRSVD